MSGSERQQRFRQRQAEAGQVRVELWLDQASVERLQRWASERSEPTAKGRISAAVVQALAALDRTHRQEHGQYVTGNDQPDTKVLERRVLDLHNAGKTAREIALILASEGITRRVYSTSSINRILTRVHQRRGG